MSSRLSGNSRYLDNNRQSKEVKFDERTESQRVNKADYLDLLDMANGLLIEYQKRESEAFEEYNDFNEYQDYLKNTYKRKIEKLLNNSAGDTIYSQNSDLMEQVDRLHRELDALRDVFQRVKNENNKLKKENNVADSQRFKFVVQKLVNDNQRIKNQRLQIQNILGDK